MNIKKSSLHSLSVFRSSSLPPPTPLQASAINTYYNNPHIPISALQPFTNEIYVDDFFFLRSDYASKLATHFPNFNNSLHKEDDDITIPSSTTNETKTNTLETPLEMYTRLLESTPEPNSITIISLGFLTNLASLLNNTSSGYDLVQQKVHEIIIMGGTYPGPGWEFNFGEFPLETKTVLENFPPNVQVTFSGFELGGVVFSGKGLKKRCDEEEEEDEERDNSPIRAAYEWYVGRCSTLRESWDPITTLYGILGLKGVKPLNGGDESSLFEYGNVGGGGYNKIVESNGTNLWIDDGQQHNQRWLKLAEGVSNVTLAEILDGFYTHGPGGCELF